MNEKQRNELSAYLDGEACPLNDIEQLLREEPEAARYVAELKQLSARLHTLPAPEIHPAFATRVMARVKNERMEHRRPWARVWLPVAAAAVFLLMAGGYWLQTETGQGLSGTEVVQPAPDMLAEAIESRIETSEDLPSIEPLLLTPDADAVFLPPSEQEETVVLAALTDFSPSVLDSTPADDLETMLDSLSDEESQTLYALIAEYVGKEDMS